MTARNGKPCKKCGTSKWYANLSCCECQRAWKVTYRQENRERIVAWNAAYRQENKEKIVADKAAYYRTKNGKAFKKAAKARRRTRKSKAGGSYAAGEFLELCRHYDCHCLRCGKQFPIGKLSADHVIAVANGGSSDIENIQPLCKSCNSSKGAKNTDYRDKVEWDKFGKPVFWWQDGLQI